MTIKKILETARTFIANESRFCRGTVACTEAGKPTAVLHASKWSLAGAIYYGYSMFSANPKDLWEAEKAVRRVVKCGPIQVYSDRTPHKYVIKNLDRAIARLDDKGKPIGFG